MKMKKQIGAELCYAQVCERCFCYYNYIIMQVFDFARGLAVVTVVKNDQLKATF